jgi:hypothetical protein
MKVLWKMRTVPLLQNRINMHWRWEMDIMHWRWEMDIMHWRWLGEDRIAWKDNATPSWMKISIHQRIVKKCSKPYDQRPKAVDLGFYLNLYLNTQRKIPDNSSFVKRFQFSMMGRYGFITFLHQFGNNINMNY